MNKNFFKTIVNFFPDNIAIIIKYVYIHKSLPNFISPRGFNEKITIIKMSKWLEDKGEFVDKYKVREYVEEKIGIQYLPKLYNIYEKSTDLNFDNLPKSFVLKLNNGSGCNLIVKDKFNLVESDVQLIIKNWLQSNFYKIGREKQYKNIKQLVIAEEYLEDSSGSLRDYKFFVFNGAVKFIQVDTGRSETHIQTFYDTQWNKLRFTYVCEENHVKEEKPVKLDEMVYLARILGKDFPFVRVDFYYTNEKIYFGELTFTPNNGIIKFRPQEKELEFGSWIDLNKYK